ncbi:MULTISPECIES: glutathione S-transferase family protein [unclassified Mesorhizobium]|uniref:glutathione S-transferase family protein n=1 Tax=unclassified Mesorhizobium TaxID=325217 RepID=UPI000F762091|nr:MULTISPECIES: glutathione S-transferase family protein [unclassified Mesorhizobium]AZO20534.1 glutathione S-transferase family protein [Mesorhizobium sp. M1E.F.Ca.ET.045.02.1.1]RUW25620.1 glutathione S-transferase family protein [Mesorhizobium sp. M1E.F.Ca.ET.041.01.1.1]RUW83807.1 glutathione S-transferase family protein [Mesorhizobium sp. M1E.F.Ca.ET.063.01.1.1]RWB55843.1 MAG: glutathione S-transferase family protein [Mesorhizobium sp.]RWD87566.1 MAG: glutathione S-transferase family prote
MKLYDYVLSPSCYKARLMAALAGVKLDIRPVDFHPGAEHRGPELMALNPAGSIPILEDGDLVLTESSAMLVYLAAKAAPQWLGNDTAAEAARVQQWLSFSHRLTASLGAARLHEMLLRPGNIDVLQGQGTTALRELEAGLVEQHIRGQRFLASDRPSVADIACFPYVALAPDGGVSLDPYPVIRLWSRAIRGLDGFIEMPGIHRLHELRPEPVPGET